VNEELKYTGKTDLIINEKEYAKINLILPKGLHVIGECRDCSYWLDEPIFNMGNPSGTRCNINENDTEDDTFGCIHFKGKK